MKKLSAFVLALIMVLSFECALAQDTKTVGILQFAEHPSLDNCRFGFLEGLKEEGFIEGENLTLLYQNAQADMGINAQIAQSFVSQKVDLLLGIATPSAMAVFNEGSQKGIPVIYSAVTDPIAAGLAKEDMLGGESVTGTSDKLPVEKQLEMIREILPEAKSIGILYTLSEVNSESSIKEYQQSAGNYGFTIEAVGIATSADISLALSSLLPKVDCLNNLTDNTVVAALPTVIGMAMDAGKPVFGSEIEQVKDGCLASEGLDYLSLGKQTGILAARVLKGEDASTIPYEQIVDSALYINPAVFEALGIAIPDTVSTRAFDVTVQ